MFVFGFNLPFGKSVIRPDSKEERPPRVIGFGIGWSRSEFIRVKKVPDQSSEEGRKRGNL